MADEKKKKKLPELYFVFDERGEFHADIANKAVVVKKGDQHDGIMEFASGLGDVQSLDNTSVIGGVDIDKAKGVFEDEGYHVVQADKSDFEEIQRELDKLLTIKGGESKKYN